MNYESIKHQILSKINTIDTREGSFTNDMVSPISLELADAYQNIMKSIQLMFLDTTEKNYLEMRAKEYGIERKSGTYASGYVTFAGKGGTAILRGSLVSTITSTLFETTEDAAIDETGTVTVPVIAKAIGNEYNVLPGMLCILPITINGVTSVTNKVVTLGGTGIESDDSLRDRVLLQLRSPATSGNAAHYRLWAMAVDGVADARVYPLHNGNGTVLVMPISSDKRALDQDVLDTVYNYIEGTRPIGASVSVAAPNEVFINVDCALTISPNSNLSAVQAEFAERFEQYIKDCVFRTNVIDIYRCVSLLYDCNGVDQVQYFKLNDSNVNLTIGDKDIQVPGIINLIELGVL